VPRGARSPADKGRLQMDDGSVSRAARSITISAEDTIQGTSPNKLWVPSPPPAQTIYFDFKLRINPSGDGTGIGPVIDQCPLQTMGLSLMIPNSNEDISTRNNRCLGGCRLIGAGPVGCISLGTCLHINLAIDTTRSRPVPVQPPKMSFRDWNGQLH
jgi:hypothetical protein